jgi:outer membrane biogenesis lipoprotein LolB
MALPVDDGISVGFEWSGQGNTMFCVLLNGVGLQSDRMGRNQKNISASDGRDQTRRDEVK